MPLGNRLLIVGNPESFHLGAHFHRAAIGLGLTTEFCDSRQAFAGSRCAVKFNWWFRGHRPVQLKSFGCEVLAACRESQPTWLLAFGLAPLDQFILEAIGAQGVLRLNFLTDDPWNPAHRAQWFLRALPCYDRIFTPRHSNMDELRLVGCRHVEYLPFAYDPEVHFQESNTDPSLSCEVAFVGGADRDRVPYIEKLVSEGVRVALYGGYWDRYRVTRRCARGHASLATLRQATAAAEVNLCLVRRANRDGHVMRSFEAAAMGGCLLVEDTGEHREIFGADGETVAFFQDPQSMAARTRELLSQPRERQRLAAAVHRRITVGKNTYADRLAIMLDLEKPENRALKDVETNYRESALAPADTQEDQG